MGIITFLKKRRKERLVTKLSKLEKLSDEYSKTINAYDELINSTFIKQNQIIDLNFSYLFSPCSQYFSEELTMYYDLYYYFKFLRNRTLLKIKRLENKL